jgi:ATP-binding protein involved in chromosome partitioning
MSIEQIIITVLAKLIDPFLGLTAVDMGLEATINQEDKQLTLNLKAGFPVDLLQDSYVPALTEALKSALPTHSIDVKLSAVIKAHTTQLMGQALRGVKNTIAIASGKGGVGKSTVTVNLAIALAKMGARVGILDADIYGPSIPLMLGKTQAVQIQGEKYLPVFAHGVMAMSIGYLTSGEQALIWRGPMLAKSLLQMLDITLWEELDYLFIDLPPGTGDIQLSLVQKIPLTAAIVVTTPQQVATLDAEKAIALFKKTNIDVLGIIENMAVHICSQCNHHETIFGSGGAEALCEKHQCLLLGQLPLNAQIRENCDQGQPTASTARNPLTDTFLKVALISMIALAKRPLSYAGKFPEIRVEL